MSFNLSNLTQKTVKTARDKAVTAAKQTAKDEIKEYTRETREQITGIQTAEAPSRPEYVPSEQEIYAQKIASGAQDKQKWGELKTQLEQELLRAHQARLQREQMRMQEMQQKSQEQNQQMNTEIQPSSIPKRKGMIGRAAQAIKSKLSSSTSKAEKQRNASG